MPMVNVREVGMAMDHLRVAMAVRVRLLAVCPIVVFMLVVLVMHMAVAVFPGLVRVLVRMPFGQVQPDPQTHQARGGPEQTIRPLLKDQHGKSRPNEWRCRKVGPCSG